MQNNYKMQRKNGIRAFFFRISCLFVSLDCPGTGYYHPTLPQEKYTIFYEIPCFLINFFITIMRPLQNAPFCPIFVSGSNFNPQNTQCMDACPDGLQSGWLKFSPSLNLNPALAGSIFQRSQFLQTIQAW